MAQGGEEDALGKARLSQGEVLALEVFSKPEQRSPVARLPAESSRRTVFVSGRLGGLFSRELSVD